MPDKCVGGSRTIIEVEQSGDCTECVGIASFTNNGDGTSTITLTNGQSYTFESQGEVGPTGPQGPAGVAPADEAWKTIGGGGDFANGEAVPGYAVAGVTDSASPIQVRKTGAGKINIRGYVLFDPAWVAGATLFVLPVGYRPAVDVFLWVGGSADPFSSIGVRTTGEVIVAGFNGADRLQIPEMQFSLD